MLFHVINSAPRLSAVAGLVLVLLTGAGMRARAAEAITLSATPPTACVMGDTVTLTAGPANSGVEFLFREGIFVTGPSYTWTTRRGYRTDPSFAWAPDANVAGRTCVLEVIARDVATRRTLGVARVPYAVYQTTLHSSVTPQSVTFTWSPVPGATTCVFWRQIRPGMFGEAGRAAASACTFTQTGLLPSTSYNYRLQLIMSDGTARYGQEVMVVTANLPGTVPVLEGAPTAPDAVKLTWSPSPGATWYDVDRSTDGATWLRVAYVNAPRLTRTDTGLLPCRAYRYRVRARTNTTSSGWSNDVRVETPAPVTLAAPVIALAAPSPQRVTVSWTAVQWAATYEVERANGLDWAAVATLDAPTTSWTDLAVSTGTPYYYRVRALAGPTRSPWSERGQIVTPILAPTHLQVTAPTGGPLLTWWSVVGAIAYRVEIRATADGNWATLGTTMGTEFRLGQSLPEMPCSYRVVAIGQNGEATSDVIVSSLLGTPVLQATAISDRAVDLAWTPSVSAVLYEVQYARNGIDWQNLAGVAGTATTYTASGLDGGTAYWFRVRARNESMVSAWSPGMRRLTMPMAPANARVLYPTPITVRVVWALGYGATSTRVETSPDGTTWTVAAMCLPTDFSHTFTGLAPRSTFYVRVASVSEAGVTLGATLQAKMP